MSTKSDKLALLVDQLRLGNDIPRDYDIAVVNLSCGMGLPGDDDLDLDACLQRLDQWADEVKHETQRQWYRFLRDPDEYENSPAYFQILVMITVLQRDLGVVYNPERVADPDFQNPYSVNPDFSDARDLFIHGILFGPGGTCASMPVLYVAVGRRLGYPLKLVEAKGHIFCRWEDADGSSFPQQRFNIEGSGRGFGMYPDEHYETWPAPWDDKDRKEGWYGKSLTVREELAVCLSNRGHCLHDNGRIAEAVECYTWARDLAPEDKRYLSRLQKTLNPNAGRYVAPPQHNPYPPGRIPKVAFGHPRPSWIPRHLPVKYVPADQADTYPLDSIRVPKGRPLKVAAGRPLPKNLPPGTAIQVVPPDQADPLPTSAKTPHLPGMTQHLAPGTRRAIDHMQKMNQINQANQARRQQIFPGVQPPKLPGQ